MTLAPGRFDDRRPIVVGDVVESKWNTMTRQDVPDGDAEGRPGKLDEGEHGGLYDGREGKSQALMCVSGALGDRGNGLNELGGIISGEANRPLHNKTFVRLKKRGANICQ